MKENLKLEVSKIIKAQRSKVFAAWCDTESLKKWSAPKPLTIPAAEIDFRVGGKYRIDMVGDMGEGDTQGNVSGTYKKIIPNELIVYTFKGTWQGDVHESLVTVTFEDVAGGTKVTLVHEGLTGAETRDNHTAGWTSILDNFADYVASTKVAG